MSNRTYDLTIYYGSESIQIRWPEIRFSHPSCNEAMDHWLRCPACILRSQYTWRDYFTQECGMSVHEALPVMYEILDDATTGMVQAIARLCSKPGGIDGDDASILHMIVSGYGAHLASPAGTAQVMAAKRMAGGPSLN